MAVSFADRVEHAALMGLLADGEARSAMRLSRELKATRRAVAEGIEQLRARGIEVAAPARSGYRLPRPVELLDTRRIRAALPEESRRRLHRLEVLFEVDSTNTRLLASTPPPSDRADVCLAELQHAGRGRRGRLWVSPFGASIAMSLGWSFRDAARANPALSLAVGVAISRALERAGARGIRLKWPNDVWFDDRKVGGILVELKTEAGGPAHVVIGVGLNVSLSIEARRELEARGIRAAALGDACAAPSRNAVAAAMLEELFGMLGRFEREGFAPFRDEWRSLDALGGRPARVLVGDRVVEGIPAGVDADGALLLDRGDRLQRFVSGEVSLRLEGDP